MHVKYGQTQTLKKQKGEWLPLFLSLSLPPFLSLSYCILNPEQWLAILAIKIQGKDIAACSDL